MKKIMNNGSLNRITKHPYFPIVLFGFVFIMIQVLGQVFDAANINFLFKASLVNNLSVVLIAYIVALGFSLLLGYSGLASLGTGGFVVFSTYIIAMLSNPKDPLIGATPFPVLISVIIALVLSLVLGVVVGFISLRIEGMYLAIVTLGISEVILEILKKWPPAGGGTPINIFKFTFLGLEFTQAQRFNLAFYIIVIFMVLLMIAMVNIIKSPTGRAMLGMKNSTSASQAMGISLMKYRLLAFVLATFTAGLGGFLHFMKNGIASTGMGELSWSLNILAAVVIGGMKSIYGVFVGTFIVYGLNIIVLSKIPFFQTYQNAYLILNGALIIIMVMFYPGGVVRLFTDLKRIFGRWKQKLQLKWKEYRYGKDPQ